MKKCILHIQPVCKTHQGLPDKLDFLRWVLGVLPMFCENAEITIRLVDEAESFTLNKMYRDKKYPTNVLAFSFKNSIPLALLGDLVICKQIVEAEAKKYKKMLYFHWAHIVVHGSLHLLGYDHIKTHDAKKMEELELFILRKLFYIKR